MLANQIAAEIPGEQVATIPQDLNEWAVIDANAGKTFGDYLAERPSAAAQTPDRHDRGARLGRPRSSLGHRRCDARAAGRAAPGRAGRDHGAKRLAELVVLAPPRSRKPDPKPSSSSSSRRPRTGRSRMCSSTPTC